MEKVMEFLQLQNIIQIVWCVLIEVKSEPMTQPTT